MLTGYASSPANITSDREHRGVARAGHFSAAVSIGSVASWFSDGQQIGYPRLYQAAFAAYSESAGSRKGVIMFKNILVPTDGSELSHETVRKAVTFASETGAGITAFYARPARSLPYAVEGVVTHKLSEADYNATDELEAREILRFVEERCRESGVKCVSRMARSNAVYEAILAAATDAECDLICMASHGRSGLGAVLLGSETIKVLTHSKIPVLVCR